MSPIADKQGAMTEEKIPSDKTRRGTAHLYEFPSTVDENGKKQPGEYREFTDEDDKKYPRQDAFTYLRCGTCVFIFRNEGKELLLQQRAGSHGAGQWAPPGGKMERHEDDAICAVREVREETELEVKYVASLGNTFDNFVTAEKGPMNWNTHWVLTKMVDASAEPAIVEPDKCSEMRWFPVQELRDMMKDGEKKHQLFLCLRNFLEAEGNENWHKRCLERLGVKPAA